MHLVAPLAAGIAGAENGTAEFYERGTTTRALHYTDFEASVIATSVDLVLDAHGGAVTYVAGLCNVVVKTSGGAILREFVAGDRDDCVEVVSPSFSGTSYDGAFTAAGQPTTLGDVLDKWFTVNHATDWNVGLPGGTSASISDAIKGSYGLVFSVKAYGAVGDGVADDTNAINAAIAAALAAGGGIVYFPPGTYRTAGGHVLDGRVSLRGAGTGASVIVLDNVGAAFLFRLAPSPAASRFHTLTDLAISSSVMAAGASVFDIPAAGCRSILSGLYLDATNFGSAAIDLAVSTVTDLSLADCVVRLGAAARAVSVAASGAVKRIALRDCRFITPAAFTAIGVVRGASLDAQGCVFDNSLTTSGTYSCIETSGSPVPAWTITGCQFLDPGGAAAVTAMNWANYGPTASVVESDNTFGSNVTAYFYTATGAARGAQIHLRSRELRSIFITDNGTQPILPIDQYGLVVFSNNAAVPVVFQAAKVPPDGARGTIICYRPTGSASPVNVTPGVNFLNGANTSAVATAAYLWEYRVTTPNTTLRMALAVDGRGQGGAV